MAKYTSLIGQIMSRGGYSHPITTHLAVIRCPQLTPAVQSIWSSLRLTWEELKVYFSMQVLGKSVAELAFQPVIAFTVARSA